MSHCTISPAMGRTYATPNDAARDFEDNKDFTLRDVHSKRNGRYCNKQQLVDLYDEVHLDFVKDGWRQLLVLWTDHNGMCYTPTPRRNER